MEMSHYYQSLTCLCYTTVVMLIFVGILLGKVLWDLSKLIKNVDETTTIVKTELEPTLKNLNQSVEIVSNVIQTFDNGVKKIKSTLSATPFKILGGVTKFTGKAAKGFFGGLCTAFKLFSKK